MTTFLTLLAILSPIAVLFWAAIAHEAAERAKARYKADLASIGGSFALLPYPYRNRDDRRNWMDQ